MYIVPLYYNKILISKINYYNVIIKFILITSNNTISMYGHCVSTFNLTECTIYYFIEKTI